MAENFDNFLESINAKSEHKSMFSSVTGQLRCSLPCNVNSGAESFFDDAKRTKPKERDLTVVVDGLEKERSVELAEFPRGYDERLIDGGGASGRTVCSTPIESHVAAPKLYTSKATLHIRSNRTNVDDPIDDMDTLLNETKSIDQHSLAKVIQPKLQTLKSGGMEEKKVDENGNALNSQSQGKKKKKQTTDKNVVVFAAETIEGHKKEIINNVDELLQFIEGTPADTIKSRTLQSKSKQLQKQHTADDGATRPGKKRNKLGGKDSGGSGSEGGRHELKKSNSMSEISGLKLDREFEAFGGSQIKPDSSQGNVVLRTNKTSVDRSRERRSWGNVEPHSFQTLSNTSSMENLEASTDNWEVTSRKKKSKKRRNSVSSAGGARATFSSSGTSSSIHNEDRRPRRAPSPDLGAVIVDVSNVKITRSMPHSEKSNDSSSDVDSVHSLPMDGPTSYADIAKNCEKKKLSPEKQERRLVSTKEKSPQLTKQIETDSKSNSQSIIIVPVVAEKTLNLPLSKVAVPDVNSIKNFPAITETTTTKVTTVVTTNVNTTSDKAVQSTLSYEEVFVREKTPQKFNAVAQVVEVMSVKTGSGQQQQFTAPISAKRDVNSSNINQMKDRRNRVLASNVQGFFGTPNDVQTELPFFSQLMRDSNNYATHRMPPDIMDVSTIEKLQRQNVCSGATGYAVPISSSGTSAIPAYGFATLPSSPNTPTAPLELPNCQSGNRGKRKKGTNINLPTKMVPHDLKGVAEDKATIVCDTSMDDNSGKMVNGISDEATSFSSPEPHQPSLVPTATSESLPPVVILSGLTKEVPSGLVFGFDINEQLLSENYVDEDHSNLLPPPPPPPANRRIVHNISENNLTDFNVSSPVDKWAKLYRPTANDRGPPKHNHDKIVSYVANAWDSFMSDNVTFYSDNL